jgi:enoyl-CoA hydratase/carnithine racemase
MTLEIENRGQVRVLRINRPEAANALSPAVIDGIGFALEAAEADPDVRVVILTGAGDRVFCAGMDLRGFVDDSGDAPERDPRGMELFLKFRREGCAKPIIGAANGTAVAGGFELLMNCDVVVASNMAKFGVPEAKRGLFPAGGGVFLGSRIPRAIANELLLTGDLITAKRAYELGLVNHVTMPELVLDEALGLARRIATCAPLALEVIKKIAHAAETRPADEAWALQEELQPVVFGSEDAQEGASAFVERREPEWKGR